MGSIFMFVKYMKQLDRLDQDERNLIRALIRNSLIAFVVDLVFLLVLIIISISVWNSTMAENERIKVLTFCIQDSIEDDQIITVNKCIQAEGYIAITHTSKPAFVENEVVNTARWCYIRQPTNSRAKVYIMAGQCLNDEFEWERIDKDG